MLVKGPWLPFQTLLLNLLPFFVGSRKKCIWIYNMFCILVLFGRVNLKFYQLPVFQKITGHSRVVLITEQWTGTGSRENGWGDGMMIMWLTLNGFETLSDSGSLVDVKYIFRMFITFHSGNCHKHYLIWSSLILDTILFLAKHIA